ncbi:MAG: DUF805 domain-containing protein [Kangiellaceae bacterium]|nr:DUF805 domain-containing protein [Kangiellaceae bacterium]|tara:strand:+ start:3766 stop:4332 length:567 start_codon:yes stop_codon:yes gene_type:complete
MTENAYVAPQSDLGNIEAAQFDQPSGLFSAKGRYRRSTYLFKLALFQLALFGILAVLGIVAAVLIPQNQGLGIVLGSVAYLIFIVVTIWVSINLAVKRLHDLNHTGWLVLLMFVPLVNFGLGLYLLFKRGEDAPNDYGNPIEPNKTHRVLGVAGILLPLVLGGILAAVSVPAYQDYVERANAAAESRQ